MLQIFDLSKPFTYLVQGRVLAAVGSTLCLYQLNTTRGFDGNGRTSHM